MKNSAVEKAWEEYFASTKVEDLESLHKEGWRTVYEVAEATGRARKTVDGSRLFDKKRVKLRSPTGVVRGYTLIRPKIKG